MIMAREIIEQVSREYGSNTALGDRLIMWVRVAVYTAAGGRVNPRLTSPKV
jgi:hypothetical protein